MEAFLNLLLTGATLFLAIFLFIRYREQKFQGHFWLSCFMISIFFLSLEETLSLCGVAKLNEILSLLFAIPCVLVGVFYFFSVSCYISQNQEFSKRNLWQLSLPIIFVVLPLLSLLTPKYMPEDCVLQMISELVAYLFTLIFGLQLIIYCVIAYFKVRKFRHHVRMMSQNNQVNFVDFMNRMTTCVLIMAVAYAADLFGVVFENQHAFSAFVYVFGVFYVGYLGIEKLSPQVATYTEQAEMAIAVITTNKSENPHIKPLRTKIDVLFENEKIFKNPELSLKTLAERLETSPHLLSRVLNSDYGESFSNFINKYRVEAAIVLLKEKSDNRLTIIEIGFAVGFNSKTAFNTAFKKHTGISPTQFLNSLL